MPFCGLQDSTVAAALLLMICSANQDLLVGAAEAWVVSQANHSRTITTINAKTTKLLGLRHSMRNSDEVMLLGDPVGLAVDEGAVHVPEHGSGQPLGCRHSDLV